MNKKGLVLKLIFICPILCFMLALAMFIPEASIKKTFNEEESKIIEEFYDFHLEENMIISHMYKEKFFKWITIDVAVPEKDIDLLMNQLEQKYELRKFYDSPDTEIAYELNNESGEMLVFAQLLKEKKGERRVVRFFYQDPLPIELNEMMEKEKWSSLNYLKFYLFIK